MIIRDINVTIITNHECAYIFSLFSDTLSADHHESLFLGTYKLQLTRKTLIRNWRKTDEEKKSMKLEYQNTSIYCSELKV